MIFLGVLFRKEQEKDIIALSKNGVSNAVNLFQWNVIEGIVGFVDNKLHIVNALPVGTYPRNYKKIILNDIKWDYMGADCYELGGINLPFLKQFVRSLKAKHAVKKLVKTEKEIIVYSAYMPYLKAAYKLPRDVKLTVIITDLPEYYDLARVGRIRRFLRKCQNKMVYKYLTRADRFVLLTEQMKYPLNVGNRPYIVVEGITDFAPNQIEANDDKKSEEKIIFYSGSLNYQFGIKTLLDAFLSINDDNARLWICGAGEAADEIKQISKTDSRIVYHGFLPLDKVAELRSKSDVLVNPRPNEGEYTKYSFPSKTMEYMASGIPVVMYKLHGIPDEYDDYLIYVKNNSAEDLRDAILSVLDMTYEERKVFGQKARQFVLSSKNKKAQGERIANFIKTT